MRGRDRGCSRRRRADARGPDRQRATGAGSGAARPGAGALPADRDDGEPDRAQAARPARRRARSPRSTRTSSIYEFGGAAVHAGLLTVGLPGIGGAAHAGAGARRDLDRRGRGRPAPCRARVENTHNVAGGRVWPLAELDAVVAVARAGGRRRAHGRRAAAERRRRARRSRPRRSARASTPSRCVSRRGSAARSARCSPGRPS